MVVLGTNASVRGAGCDGATDRPKPEVEGADGDGAGLGWLPDGGTLEIRGSTWVAPLRISGSGRSGVIVTRGDGVGAVATFALGAAGADGADGDGALATGCDPRELGGVAAGAVIVRFSGKVRPGVTVLFSLPRLRCAVPGVVGAVLFWSTLPG